MERVDAPKILHKLEERINAALPGLRVIYVSDCSRDGAVCPLLFIEQFLHPGLSATVHFLSNLHELKDWISGQVWPGVAVAM